MTENVQKQIVTEYEGYLSRLETYRDSKDLDGLARCADEIEAKWGQKALVQYFELMLKVCIMLSSFDLGDFNKQTALAQRYATEVLEKSEMIPLEIQAQLLLHLQDDTQYLKGAVSDEEWAQRRRTKARLWLRALHLLESEFDRDFDFSDYPTLNVQPPPGANQRAGVAPEHIKDPILRAEYEAAIAANAQKTARYNRQYRLRELDQEFSPMAEQYLVTAYASRPFASDELEQLLNRYIPDEVRRSRILSRVRQRAPGE